MKLYLDDVRPAPAGWKLVRWPQEMIELLMTGAVTEVSLDHDLGDDKRGTGYDVITWLEKAVVDYGLVPPNTKVHSAYVPAKKRMERGIKSVNHLYQFRSRYYS